MALFAIQKVTVTANQFYKKKFLQIKTDSIKMSDFLQRTNPGLETLL